MINKVKIQKEEKSHRAKVRIIYQFAFPTIAEANLVDKIRSELNDYVSLVALFGSHVVGHILFTPVTITENKDNFKWCGLAPMAVEPSLQGRGIGSKLVVEGLQMVATKGYDGAVVLGHPEYYLRFGFQPAHKFGIICSFEAPEDAFMAKEITKGVLENTSGLVRYHHLFNNL